MSEAATTVLGEELSDDKSVQQDGEKVTQTPSDEFLARYVGEGKKYKSVEDLAKAYANAETFIETLKTEKQTLEQEYSQKLSEAKTVEDIMSVLTAKPTEPVTQTTEKTDDTVGLTPEQVQALVEKHLTEKQQVELITANQQKAWEGLDKIFGSREASKKAVKDYVGDSMQKRELADKMGSFAPDDFVKLVSLQKGESVNFTEPGDTSGDDTSVLSAGEMSWDQVRKIRKENPALFKSREFQKKLHKLTAEGKLK